MTSVSDGWVAGDRYESFMGRWSRPVAGLFLDWLNLSRGLHWLDVGCGTGALAQAICKRSPPASLTACDPSVDFVAFARSAAGDCPASFEVAGSDNLPVRAGGFDAVVSGLVLNFLPRPLDSVRSMMDRLRPGGVMAAYVWDYAEGMQFLRIFWDEAGQVDASARELDEALRFPLCHPDRLAELWQRAGAGEVATTALEIQTVFASFGDFWAPFLAGTGPAPSFVAALAPDARSWLALRLERRLGPSADGTIRLAAGAFAVRGVRPA